MNRIPIWVLLFSFFLFVHTKSSIDDVKLSLINFLGTLSNSNGQPDPTLGWNSTTHPCNWTGIVCDTSASVSVVVLKRFNFSGTLDAYSLCNNESIGATLTVLSIDGNYITGKMPAEIANCKKLTHLYIGGNRFSGSIPQSFSMLSNLRSLDISNNIFSGKLPNGLAHISGLNVFFAQDNHLSGAIPQFVFFNLHRFNVSFNNFTGRIPNVHGLFNASSFLGNSELCGDPLPKRCRSSEQLASARKSQN